MNPRIKIPLYVVLALGMIVSAVLFYRAYRAEAPAAEPRKEEPVEGAPAQVQSGATRNYSALITRALVFIGCAIGLGLLIARDFSDYMGSQATEFIFNDDADGQRDPEYEEAERLWTNGQHLEAVRLMREYLHTHPRQIHVALRIAEIYEQDLNNPLAAALEYEEIIKKPLPPERWGWAAIHLANLYSGRLGKTEQAMALLHRIVNEYGQTAAAKKARERLGLPEDAAVTEPGSSLPAGFRPRSESERLEHHQPVSETVKPLKPAAEERSEPEPEPAPPPPPQPQLPPGFRPKG
jgi:hypothetical protein